MDRTAELLVRLVSSQPHQRPNDVIESIIPWLQKTSAFLREVEPNVIQQLLQCCGYKRGEPNEILMRQGDTGDCMYIVLSGKVDIYIDGTRSGEDLETGREVPPSPVDGHDVTAVNRSPLKFTDVELAIRATRAGHVTQSTRVAPGLEPRSGVIDERQRELPEGGTSPVIDMVNDLDEPIAELDRSQFGQRVVQFGAGKCVGELAMMNEDSLRNATVICEDFVDFVVIGRQLYVDTIKANQEKDFAERRRFVVSHPLFKGWNSKLRQLLQMSLIREAFEFDQPIVRQGQSYDGLIFIRSGQAMVMVEPSKHAVQYPTFMSDPLPPVIVRGKSNQQNASHRSKPSRRGKVASTEIAPHPERTNVTNPGTGRLQSKRASSAILGSSTQTPASRTRVVDGRRAVGPPQGGSMTGSIAVKRREGYAAAERRMRGRTVRLCTVETGEMVGDIETVFRLESYSETVVCTRSVQVYILTTKNLERLLSKRNTTTMDSLRSTVEWKLTRRLGAGGSTGRHTVHEVPTVGASGVPGVVGPTTSLASFYSVSALLDEGLPVPLVGRLLYRLRRPPEPTVEVSTVLIGSKSLPDRETQFRHLMRAWIDDQATSLVEPCVPGSVFYRLLAAQKAEKRSRRQQTETPTNQLDSMTERKKRQRCKTVIENRKPRTVLELKRLISRPEHDFEILDEAESAKQLQIIENDESRLMFERLVEDCCLEEPVLSGDALTTLHQMVLDRLEMLLDGDSVFDTSINDHPKSKVNARDEESSRDLPPPKPEVDSTMYARDVRSRKVHLTPRRKITDDGDANRPTVDATTGMPHDQIRLDEGVTAAADTDAMSVELGKDADVEANVLKTGTHTHAVRFDLQLERSKTFLTEVCDSQSEPGANLTDSDDVTDTRPDKATRRTIKSARGALEHRSHSAAMTSLAMSGSDTEARVSGGTTEADKERQRRLSLLRQLDEAAKHRRQLKTRLNVTAYRRGCRADRLLENPTYRDWETSDRSLRFLEQRIANFVTRSGCTALSEHGKQSAATSGPVTTMTAMNSGANSNVILPKLKRYESTEDVPKFPKPGGRVVVKKQVCAQRRGDALNTDHEHMRIHLVPELPDYQRLRNAKLVTYHLVDDVREQWIQTQR